MRIAALECEPLPLQLTEAFGIAGGSQLQADNVLVRISLTDGSVGLGEAAPFPAFNGDSQAACMRAAGEAAPALIGVDAGRIREVSARLDETCPSASARAAIEMACLDAFTRATGVSLWHWFGGHTAELCTDITVVTGSADHAATSARKAASDGFERIKVKVGGSALQADVERLRAIFQAAPEAAFILDANASLSADDAIALLDALGPDQSRVILFEQPTAKDDIAGLAQVRNAGVRVAADESVTSATDLPGLQGAADVVNIKLMKSGVVAAWDLALAARALGFELMVGGLVESDLAMSVSACMAGGLGGFSFVDLDTALFVVDAPFEGGIERRGPNINVRAIAAGHGVDRCGA